MRSFRDCRWTAIQAVTSWLSWLGQYGSPKILILETFTQRSDSSTRHACIILHPFNILQLSLEELRKSQRDFKSVQRDLKRDQLQLQRQENQLELEIKKAARQGNNILAKSLAKVSSVNPSASILIPPDTDTLLSFSAIDTGSQPASKEPKGWVTDIWNVTPHHCNAKQYYNGVRNIRKDKVIRVCALSNGRFYS